MVCHAGIYDGPRWIVSIDYEAIDDISLLIDYEAIDMT
jgi:hypothetical protein